MGKTLTNLLKMIIDDIKISLIDLADALKIFKEYDGPANVRRSGISQALDENVSQINEKDG